MIMDALPGTPSSKAFRFGASTDEVSTYSRLSAEYSHQLPCFEDALFSK